MKEETTREYNIEPIFEKEGLKMVDPETINPVSTAARVVLLLTITGALLGLASAILLPAFDPKWIVLGGQTGIIIAMLIIFTKRGKTLICAIELFKKSGTSYTKATMLAFKNFKAFMQDRKDSEENPQRF